MTDIRLPSVKTLDHRIRTFVPGLCKHPIHEIPWINIMLSGSLEYILNDEPLILTEGYVSFFHMGDFVERREQQTDVQYISMRFSPGDMVLHLNPIIPLIGEKQHTLVKLFLNYYFESSMGNEENRYATQLILKLLLMELENNCTQNETNEWIAGIRSYVMQNYMNGIHTSDVAKSVSMNPSYCNTLYKKHTGETISELINRIQLENAISKLLYSPLSVKEIACECGFNDMYYFSRWFSKQTGLSPRKYRKNIRL